MFAPNYYPATRYGGPVRSSHGVAKALIEQGHLVEVWTTDVNGPGRLDVPLCERTEYEGVPVTYFPVSTPRRLYYSPRMREAAARRMNDFDVVHLNGIYLWPGQMLARRAHAAGLPFVLSPRGMLGPEMIAGKSAMVKKLWIATGERFTLRHAALIHVTSESEAQGVRDLGYGQGRLRVIGNGVSRPVTEPDPAEVENIWRHIPQGQRVAFLGRIDWTKGVDLAIEAVMRHGCSQLLIAGTDQIGLQAKLEPKLRGTKGSAAGRFIGEVDDERKWALLKGADVVLAPSVRESFGMAVAEALAVGTPVICTPGVGAHTIIDELDPASVVPRNAKALEQALARLLGDAAVRQDYGQRAVRYMADHYSWNAIAQQMAGLYRTAGAPQ